MTRTFVRITNEDIFKEVVETKSHVIKTNGKVRTNRWIASTALGLITALIFLLISGTIRG